jgi:hypothetical protein
VTLLDVDEVPSKLKKLMYACSLNNRAVLNGPKFEPYSVNRRVNSIQNEWILKNMK